MLTTWKKIIFIFGLIFVACNTSMAADKDVSKAQNHPSGQWEYKIIAPNLLNNYQVWLAKDINRLAREEGWEIDSIIPNAGGADAVIFLRRPLRE